MKRSMFATASGVLTAALLTASVGFAQDGAKTPDRSAKTAEKTDPTAACMTMMQDAGVTDEGKKAMREFMQSKRAPKAMTNMMEMARRMGDGDLMVGMTRMMEMMGSMGGGSMMGGDAVGGRADPRRPVSRRASEVAG
jgi:hypothetical protein